jgi:hypothetical protein
LGGAVLAMAAGVLASVLGVLGVLGGGLVVFVVMAALAGVVGAGALKGAVCASAGAIDEAVGVLIATVLGAIDAGATCASGIFRAFFCGNCARGFTCRFVRGSACVSGASLGAALIWINTWAGTMMLASRCSNPVCSAHSAPKCRSTTLITMAMLRFMRLCNSSVCPHAQQVVVHAGERGGLIGFAVAVAQG